MATLTPSLPEYVVGVDIGGTNMVAAVISSETAHVLSRLSVPTEAARGPEDGLRRLGNLIDHVIAAADLTLAQIGGIGVGCTGPIDTITGRVHNPYTLPTWDDIPLMDYLTERFKLPGILLGDCHVAALGEYWAGAGQNTRHMLYITVGTGIGGGMIINGRLHRGVGLDAAEVGHHVIDMNGPACYCGAKGCWEMLAAAPAITRFAMERVQESDLLFKLAGGDKAQITPKLVSEAAQQGDPMAVALMRQTGVYLGVGIANLMNIIAPEMVVMGGGVMQSWDILEPVMLEIINERNAMIPFDQISLRPASLRLNAGVVGAARGLLDHMQGRL